MKRTTNLEEITYGVDSNFTWGEAVKKHTIGEYNIVECHPWKYSANRIESGNPDYEAKKEYHCYIDGKNISRGAMSLDEALATCIAVKHDGANTRADLYFIKMIS